MNATPMRDPGDYNRRVHVRNDKTNIRRLGYLTILLFASPPEWRSLAAGIVLVLASILLHGWAAGYLARAGYAEREKVLTVRGPYRHSRNPYYLAQMTMDFGFFLLAGRPLLYLFYFPVIFYIYRRWVTHEEMFLQTEFGDSYRAFKRDVPRWRFRIRPGPARGSELHFRWATFNTNRELPRSLSHLFLLAAFILMFFAGNPFGRLSGVFRVTLLGAIAAWLLLRDVYALDVSRKSIGWLVVAFLSATMAAVVLVSAPVWQPWRGMEAWLSIGAGLCFGSLCWVAVVPDVNGMLRKATGSFFLRPICYWYVLTLGLGLLSCTLGGVWLGIMLPFTLWALHLARVAPIPIFPPRVSVSLALLAMTCCAAVLAVVRQLS
jgi:protein-S-isoprenylcysteine O-methyltransferase Ste14